MDDGPALPAPKTGRIISEVSKLSIPNKCQTPLLTKVIQKLDTHMSSLSSHLHRVELLSTDQTKATPQIISQVVESAQKLLDQFATLREDLVRYYDTMSFGTYLLISCFPGFYWHRDS